MTQAPLREAVQLGAIGKEIRVRSHQITASESSRPLRGEAWLRQQPVPRCRNEKEVSMNLGLLEASEEGGAGEGRAESGGLEDPGVSPPSDTHAEPEKKNYPASAKCGTGWLESPG